MRRIAAPMVGGMVTSTLLTLIVIPVLYHIWRARAAVPLPEHVAGGGHQMQRPISTSWSSAP